MKGCNGRIRVDRESNLKHLIEKHTLPHTPEQMRNEVLIVKLKNQIREMAIDPKYVNEKPLKMYKMALKTFEGDEIPSDFQKKALKSIRNVRGNKNINRNEQTGK